jgi:hypothetical protein
MNAKLKEGSLKSLSSTQHTFLLRSYLVVRPMGKTGTPLPKIHPISTPNGPVAKFRHGMSGARNM